MFGNDARMISVLTAELNDLRRMLESQQAAFASERKTLIDRIIALSNPAVHRELNPRQAVVHKPPVVSRINFPGHEPNQRPPHPRDMDEAEPDAEAN
jgi:hypothetical protein